MLPYWKLTFKAVVPNKALHSTNTVQHYWSLDNRAVLESERIIFENIKIWMTEWQTGCWQTSNYFENWSNDYIFQGLTNTGLFKTTVGVLTTCHTQYTWDRSTCIFLFNRTTLQVFVTYLTDALYVHPLWFYKHQHDNRVRSTQNAFSLLFAAIVVNCAPSGEMHNYCTPHIIKENLEHFLIRRCNYILLSQVYCVWQVVKPPTIIFKNPVLLSIHAN